MHRMETRVTQMHKVSGHEAEFWNGEFFHFLFVEFGIFC